MYTSNIDTYFHVSEPESNIEEAKANIGTLKIVYSDGVIDTPMSLLKGGYIKWAIVNDNGDILDTVKF